MVFGEKMGCVTEDGRFEGNANGSTQNKYLSADLNASGLLAALLTSRTRSNHQAALSFYRNELCYATWIAAVFCCMEPA